MTDILTYEQKVLLNVIATEPYFCEDYYFTGGTPLSLFYLHHRISEDIDLFSEKEMDIMVIDRFIGDIKKKLSIKKADFRQFFGLYTYQLYFTEKKVVKIDFNYYPFPCIEKGMLYKKLRVDSLFDIAVNKVHTISRVPRSRDFIDIYFIIKEKNYSFHELLMYAKTKFDWHIDPIQLGSRLLLASQSSDYPKMIKAIDHNEWKTFFINEARKLEREIFK